jgi:hypothetical protein
MTQPTHGIYRSGPQESWGPCRIGSAVWENTPPEDRQATGDNIEQARHIANGLNKGYDVIVLPKED